MARLINVELQGATLPKVRVWRAWLAPRGPTNSASAPNVDFRPMREPDVKALFDTVNRYALNGTSKDLRLQQLETSLRSDWGKDNEEALGKPWRELNDRGRKTDIADPELTQVLAALRCGADGAPYIARQLVMRGEAPSLEPTSKPLSS